MSLKHYTGSIFWAYVQPTSIFQTVAHVPKVVQNQQPGGTQRFVLLNRASRMKIKLFHRAI